jgi:hypothetical protein
MLAAAVVVETLEVLRELLVLAAQVVVAMRQILLLGQVELQILVVAVEEVEIIIPVVLLVTQAVLAALA